jgi:hypothetical protein
MYDVVYYCDVLPMYETVEKGLNLEEAEKVAKQLTKAKKWTKGKMNCCQYFVLHTG